MTSTTCKVQGAALVQLTLAGMVTLTVCGAENACWCIRMPSATTGRTGGLTMVAAQVVAGVTGSGSVFVVWVDDSPLTRETRYQPACGTTSSTVMVTVVVPSAFGTSWLTTREGPLAVPFARRAASLPHGAVFS